jgi:hypothetical protein
MTSIMSLGDLIMENYIFFDDALHLLINAFLGSVAILMAVSGVGLVVIESIEETSDR